MDLRSSPRLPVQCPIVFSGDHIVGEGMVINLSVPGCAIKTAKFLKEGDYLELRVLMPDHGTPLAVDLAKVRWTENGQFGVQSIRVRQEEQLRLIHLLKKPAEAGPLN